MKVNTSETPLSVSKNFSSSIKNELEVVSSKYHIKAAWLAIIFDPLFAITDYINIPASWKHLLIIRIGIAIVTAVVLSVRKKYQLPSYVVVLIPFLLIALQNAYTFSVIGNDVILGHSLNFMALLIAGGMFILWRWTYSAFVIFLSAIATAFFVTNNHSIDVGQFFVKGGFLLIAVGIFMIILIKARYDLTVKEIRARLALKISNDELAIQKTIVELKNKKITDSINYAKRIQDSILGQQSRIDNWFTNGFVFFKPKDILSGDFYWFYENPETNIKIIIVGDCTGHGIPAAMMTVMGNSILNEIIVQRKIYEPDEILYELDKRIIESFSTRQGDENQINDGMDVAILSFTENHVQFAAAKNPLCFVKNNELSVLTGSKFPIGSTQYKNDKIYEKEIIEIKKGDKFYIYSDGFQDQFGGITNHKYLTKRFKKFLHNTSNLTMAEQRIALENEFEQWKGIRNKQTDDILIVGIEV